jgi:hypothetical protein
VSQLKIKKSKLGLANNCEDTSACGPTPSPRVRTIGAPNSATVEKEGTRYGRFNLLDGLPAVVLA